MQPNPFSDINIMTEQQAIFWFKISSNNHNLMERTRIYIHTYFPNVRIYFRYLGQLLTLQQSNIERTSRVKLTRYLHVDHIQLALMVDFIS